MYFQITSKNFHNATTRCTIGSGVKSYNQYCPIAHALDVVGERWSLLIVRELIEHEQLRYSDLHANLEGCGTNILATRLKDLERHGVVARRRLPPPAASTVYELTDYGQELRPVMHVLAHWGARSLGPPAPDEVLESGWLAGALRMAFPPHPTEALRRVPRRRRGRGLHRRRVAGRARGEPRHGHRVRPGRVLSSARRPRTRRGCRTRGRGGVRGAARHASARRTGDDVWMIDRELTRSRGRSRPSRATHSLVVQA